MQIARLSVFLAGGLLLTGCAASVDSEERTVFYNPYAPPELANGPVGPEYCDGCSGEEWLPGLVYPGEGNIAYDREGKRVPLSRRERFILQERAERIEAAAEQVHRAEEIRNQFDRSSAFSLPNGIPSGVRSSDSN
ncbi:hypothetical protein [uncultured Erythrobacter sp.]|uniref:hypothetical protein n=1 Tax=uncultured Erythrobacter sp. TaxID=263913 RepID=UPI00262C05C9|nr:hypothetical protein [uncultured Erythrobacter sp.]